MDENYFQKRIDYRGDLNKLFEQVVKDYQLGDYKSFKVILKGYEDFNVIVETNKGKYLVKVMASSRSAEESEQYVKIIRTALDHKIAHPKLYKGPTGDLYQTIIDGKNVCLTIMDYIEGSDFYSLSQKPTDQEIVFLAKEAAKISQLKLNPVFVYDVWAIPNFLKEYDQIKDKLEKADLKYIKPLAEVFNDLNIDQLPKCFIHGDIICTNVIRSVSGELFIIDYAVANIYPRVQELAILLCDLLFVKDKDRYLSNFNLLLTEYQKIVRLEQKEIDILPTYIKLAHAMHIVPATREKINGTKLPENDFWLKSGQEGIRIASEIWK